jgi:hypothetical protein
VLDGRTSSTNRAFASDRTIKISASIAVTFWIKTAEQRYNMVDLPCLKTVIESTTFSGRGTLVRRGHSTTSVLVSAS